MSISLLRGQILQIKVSESRFANITDEEFKTAADVFVFFNTCAESWGKWFAFYTDLFQTKPADQIVLTLNRLLKSGDDNKPNRKDLKIVLRKILQKITTLLPKTNRDIRSSDECKS